MQFIDFARAHGLIMNDVIAHRWVRVPTADHPRSKNGAYKYLGNVGFVQNHAQMTEVASWFADGDAEIKIDRAELNRLRLKEAQERAQMALQAAQKAQRVLGQCRNDLHPYLSRKGFPNQDGLVWEHKDQRLLVIPMRIAGQLVGCQLIDKEGSKKFLRGQKTKGAAFEIGSGSKHVWCEGAATGYSIARALKLLNLSSTIHICFSAANMQHMANKGFVVADNDKSQAGLKAAQATGLPYWISPNLGEDFNDWASNKKPLEAANELRKLAFAK